jgi:epoxyqueuosine reductase
LSPGSAAIKQRAQELGFDLCGIAPAAAFPELGHFTDWLARGYAGEMTYLEKSAGERADIRRFLPSARSVIVTATNYNGDRGSGIGDQGSGTRDQRAGDAVRVAKYARGLDYHKVLEDRLAELVEWMRGQAGEPFDARIFVDKHHVQERVHGYYAGLGWIGKNTCLINTGQGSWLFLAGVATSLALEPDQPPPDQCGSCTLCIDACPTGALVDARELDATKCISYLTIEVDGALPEAQRSLVGSHVYGCDICQDVCPWNLAAPVSSDPSWHGPQRDGQAASELWQRSDFDLHQLVKGSAMTYLPLSRLRRNLATVIANSGDASLAAALDRPGGAVKNAAHSTLSPVVEETVAWAKRRLSAE